MISKPFDITLKMRWLLIVILLPLSVLCQEKKQADITGLWVGELYNEITKQTLHYEVAISEHRGNYTAYSYTTFIMDTFNIVGVKELKVTRIKEKTFLEDERWMVRNTKVQPPSGVRQITSLGLSQIDTMMLFTGKFITTRTREYRKPVTGTVRLERKADPKSELMRILDSLGISKTLSFLESKPMEEKKDTVAVVPPPPVVDELPAPPLLIGNNEIRKLSSVASRPLSNRQPRGMVSLVKQLDVEIVSVAPPPPPPPVEKPVKKDTVVIKPAPKQDTIVVKPPPPPKEEKKEQIEGLAKRTVEIIRTVEVFEDSIRLDLYDNGYVDGDSISIIVNGKVILEHQLLSTRPITKWIYLTPDMGDEIRIIMYAENLGSIPPNTGLLSVSDGPTRYDILFSGNLKENASIILKRKKK